jgi:hypothetical protein
MRNYYYHFTPDILSISVFLLKSHINLITVITFIVIGCSHGQTKHQADHYLSRNLLLT